METTRKENGQKIECIAAGYHAEGNASSLPMISMTSSFCTLRHERNEIIVRSAQHVTGRSSGSFLGTCCVNGSQNVLQGVMQVCLCKKEEPVSWVFDQEEPNPSMRKETYTHSVTFWHGDFLTDTL